MSQSDELFLEQYQKELLYLRDAGSDFAKEYPKIARRLEWDGDESKDPHVERLIESFAFLTAKLQRNIDDRFPIISNALLSAIYPQFLNPIPSMSIAHFTMEKAKATPGYSIPKGTSLGIQSKDEVNCTFQTGYDMKLWPVHVEEAKVFVKDGIDVAASVIESSHVLRLHLKSTNTNFQELEGKLNTLRFYIHSDSTLTSIIYDSLFFAKGRIILEDHAKNNIHILPSDSLKSVGFSRDEFMIPSTPNSHYSYRLLQEFFSFPQKFLFFDIENLKLSGIKNDLILYIPLTQKISDYSSSISAHNFLTNCTPIINLFKKMTEPLKITHKETNYRLIPDTKREKTTEIHSIQSVSVVLGDKKDKTIIPSYFSFDFETTKNANQIYWFALGRKSQRADIPGRDLWINFVDFNFKPENPATDIAWADTLCTNRFAAEQIPAGGRLTPDEPLPTGKIICLHAPTAQFIPAETGEAQWKLISQLNLNHLSLIQTQRFKNLLELYIPDGNNSAFEDVDSILNITSTPKVRRICNEAWRGFVQGLGIEITLNEQQFIGSSMHLFCDVLQHFLGLYVSFNSFCELSLKTNKRDYILKKWQPLCGYQHLV